MRSGPVDPLQTFQPFPWLNGYLDREGRRSLFCPWCGVPVDWRGACPACGWRSRRPAWMRSLRRHHRRRVIKRRMFIRRYIWGIRKFGLDTVAPGKFAKHNLACSCWMCRWEKKNGIEKPKYRVLRELEWVQLGMTVQEALDEGGP